MNYSELENLVRLLREIDAGRYRIETGQDLDPLLPLVRDRLVSVYTSDRSTVCVRCKARGAHMARSPLPDEAGLFPHTTGVDSPRTNE